KHTSCRNYLFPPSEERGYLPDLKGHPFLTQDVQPGAGARFFTASISITISIPPRPISQSRVVRRFHEIHPEAPRPHAPALPLGCRPTPTTRHVVGRSQHQASREASAQPLSLRTHADGQLHPH